MLSEKLNDVKTKIDNILYQIPNVPNKNVPTWNTQEDNVVIFESDLNIIKLLFYFKLNLIWQFYFNQKICISNN